jgi:hypothetical protein
MKLLQGAATDKGPEGELGGVMSAWERAPDAITMRRLRS